MTNEQLASLIQSDREGYKELLPILWKRVQKLLYMKANQFYRSHSESCARHGVEAADIRQGCYSVFLASLEAFKPEKETLFVSYFNHQFQVMTAELLNIRTERGRQEPLNNCDSLDRLIDPEDGEGATLGDLVPDPVSASIDDDALNALNREQEAKAVREAVASLPDLERLVIERYYFENRDLNEIGLDIGVSVERVRQIRQRAFTILRRDRRLRIIYLEYQQHKRGAKDSRFQCSPQYFELYRKLREQKLSYGKIQAELFKMQRWFDAEDNAARSADGSDTPEFTDKLSGILADYLTRQKLIASL